MLSLGVDVSDVSGLLPQDFNSLWDALPEKFRVKSFLHRVNLFVY